MIDATRSTNNQENINSYVTGYNKGKLDSKIEFIEKAYEWIKENFENYVGVDVSEYYIYDDEFADDFRKAMEE